MYTHKAVNLYFSLAVPIFLVLFCSKLQGQTACQTESSALMALYNATNGANWTNNTNWGTGCPCDAATPWFGVTCSAGLVTQINLPANNLNGNIPIQLNQLQGLRNLLLQGNQLTGSLPAELGDISTLRNLNLSNNQLSGALPETWGDLAQLKYLYLENNELTGSIPSTWEGMDSLAFFHAFSNQLSGVIPSNIGNINSLEVLRLELNNLTGPLPTSFGQLDTLRTLLLQGNQITDSLPSEWEGMNNLRSLNLSNNQLSGSLPDTWGNMNKLKFLYLERNGLSGSIPSTWEGMDSLAFFYSYSNQLTGSIPSSMGNITTLEVLRLELNNLSGPLPVSFGQLQSIRTLLLQGNQITDSLPSGWGSMSSLRSLNLSNNQLSGSLPETWGQLAKLKFLYLENNGLSGSIPTTWEGMDSLAFFHAFSNQLSGPIPSTTGNILTLESLRLESNNLEGPLPTSFGQLNSIRTLLLHANQITGSLPPEWSGMGSVRALNLSSNQLSGAIPGSWGSMDSLQTLDLSSNSLDGCYPEELQSLCSVPDVRMDNNSGLGDWTAFCDSGANACLPELTACQSDSAALMALFIATDSSNWTQKGNWGTGCPCDPANPWYGVTCDTLGQITRLELPSNNLSGPIPPEIGQLGSLTYLNLGENALNTVPAEIGQLANLTHLYVHKNDILSLPNEIGNLSELILLHVGWNELTQLPGTIGNLDKVTSLRANANQLTSLPPEIGDMAVLRSLHLYVNQLTTLPPEIGDLDRLDGLYLQTNPLTSLPPEIGDLALVSEIHFTGCQLTSVPPELGNLPRLSFISFNGNNLTSLPDNFFNLPNLTRLFASQNNFTSLSPNVANLSRLHTLILDRNNLTSLPKELASLSFININLKSNAITCLPEELTSFCSVATFDISDNPIDFDLYCTSGGVLCSPCTAENLSFGKTATQSSTYGNGLASIAVDSITIGDSPWTANIQHTQTEQDPWWEVDLGLTADLESITLYNRTSSQELLSQVYLFSSHQAFDPTASLEDLLGDPSIIQIAYQADAVGDSVTFTTDASGRYIRVQLDKNNGTLHMAEVKVMGCEIATDTFPPMVPYGLVASNTTGESVQITWETPVDVGGGVAGYYVFQDGLPLDTVVGTSIQVGQLIPGSTYAFSIQAFDFAGNESDTSTSISVNTLFINCTNLAIGKPAAQSSQYGNGVAGLANDGNTAGSNAWSADLQHTQTENQAWWEVDLGVMATLDSVIIFNRTDCCQNRLSDFYVLVSPGPFFGQATLSDLLNDENITSQHYPGQAGDTTVLLFSLNTIGKYVRIQLNGTNSLHMAEVEVNGCQIPEDTLSPSIPQNLVASNINGTFLDLSWDSVADQGASGIAGYYLYQNDQLIDSTAMLTYRVDSLSPGFTYSFQVSAYDYAGNVSEPSDPVFPTTLTSDCGNLALGKATEQSSQYGNGSAEIAVDGIQTGDSPWGGNASIIHTNSEANPWWQVDLGTVASLDSIIIYNRTSQQERLSNFYVFISEQAFPTGASLADLLGDTTVNSLAYNSSGALKYSFIPGGSGQYIRIQLAESGILHMAEVEVYGCESLLPLPPTGKTLQELVDCYPLNTNLVQAIFPSLNQNYIRTTTYRKDSGIQEHDKWQNITYIDGLGRPIQSIEGQASPAGVDMVTHMEYDVYGRQPEQFLPYAAPLSGNTAGSFRALTSNPLGPISSFYQGLGSLSDIPSTRTPVAITEFEASPLNRVVEQGAPGEDWQPVAVAGQQGSGEHTVITEYGNNTAAVPGFAPEILDDASPAIQANYYPPSTLNTIRVLDENGALSETATDNQGRTIYKSVQVTNAGDLNSVVCWQDTVNFATTYFIYDVFGNVRYVIQPEGWKGALRAGLTPSVKEYFCFQYEYDGRQRVKRKRVPGADWVSMVYDKLDRVVATQDGNLKQKGQWLVTKYDSLGRPIMTGISITNVDQAGLQLNVNGNSRAYEIANGDSYTNSLAPQISAGEFHSITYYDTYNFLSQTSGAYAFQEFNQIGFLGTSTDQAFPYEKAASDQGRVTGIKVFVLDAESVNLADEELLTVTYYDKYGREIQTIADNHLGGKEFIANRYNFAGELLEAVQLHNSPQGGEQRIHKAFVYDHRGRVNQVLQQINEDPAVVLASHSYDELGQLVEKNLGGMACDSALQSVDFQYNIRGWMTDINSLEASSGLANNASDLQNDLFAMKLSYEGLFNGNISGISWEHAIGDLSQDVRRDYSFTYDLMNRLTGAAYAVSNGTPGENFSVPSLTYDLNGNIQNLLRNGNRGDGSFGALDNLSYTYQGNRLTNLTDNSGFTQALEDIDHFVTRSNGSPYSYDASGNITVDPHKGLTFAYNHLNKPVSAIDPSDTNRNISWIYSADGTKLQETYSGDSSATHDYVGGFFYKSNTLLHIAHEEGRALKIGEYFRYEFNLTDHLGNIRVSLSDVDYDGAIEAVEGEVLQVDQYYPFGMRLGGLSYNSGTENRYRYNGKEYHQELNLGLYDYGARMYDPSIGRFTTQDRFSEKYLEMTPYQYAANNPILFVDINGDSLYVSHKGRNLLYLDGKFFENGQQVQTNKRGKVKGKGKGFFRKTKTALDDVRTSSKGKQLVDDIANNSNADATIVNADKRPGPRRGSNGFSSSPTLSVTNKGGGTIFFAPNKKTGGLDFSGSDQRPSFIALAHELAHAEDLIAGTLDRNTRTFTIEGNTYTVGVGEEYAVHVENLIRNELGISLREYYGVHISQNGTKRGFYRMSNSNGTSVYDVKTALKRFQRTNFVRELEN